MESALMELLVVARLQELDEAINGRRRPRLRPNGRSGITRRAQMREPRGLDI
jgi:hypothetical protein